MSPATLGRIERLAELKQFWAFEPRRSSPAEIERIERQSLGQSGDFAAQCGEIAGDEIIATRSDGEITVATVMSAKGNVQIDRAGVDASREGIDWA